MRLIRSLGVIFALFEIDLLLTLITGVFPVELIREDLNLGTAVITLAY
jgi:hypothetical protein